MKGVAFVVVSLCAGCNGDDAGPQFPVEPGTNGSAVTTGTSGEDFGDAGGVLVLRGRVCIVEDIRFQNACAITGASGLQVSFATQVVMTAEDGTFEIISPVVPVPTQQVFTVTGPGILTTSQALNLRAQINTIRRETFEEMLVAAGITAIPGTGSVIATVTQNNVAAVGVTASSVPLAAFGPFFDGTDPMPWVTNATGVNGIVWFPGVVAGPVDLNFNTLTGGQAIVGGVQVINGGITMVETALP